MANQSKVKRRQIANTQLREELGRAPSSREVIERAKIVGLTPDQQLVEKTFQGASDEQRQKFLAGGGQPVITKDRGGTTVDIGGFQTFTRDRLSNGSGFVPGTPTDAVAGGTTAPEEPGTSVPPFTTTRDERAQALRDQELKDAAVFESNLFGETTAPGSTLQEKRDELLARQRADREEAMRQATLASNIEQRNIRELEQSSEASIAGTVAGLATGREQAASAGAPLVVSQFRRSVESRVANARDRLSAAQSARADAMRRLEEAQADDRAGFAAAARSQLAAAENLVIQAETALLQEQQRMAEFSLTEDSQRLDNLQGILGTLGTRGIAQLDASVVGAIFEANGFAPSLGFAFQAAQKELVEAEKTKDQVAIEQARANLGKTIDSIQGEAFQAVKNMSTLKSALSSGVIDQKAFDSLSVSFGFSEAPKARAERLKIEADTRQINLKNTRKVAGGASNGAGREDPTRFIAGFNFGDGKRGAVVTDSQGEPVGRISSPFGADHSAISGEKTHNGVDIVFNEGNVIALNSGTIVNKGFAQGTYGGFVWIEGDDGSVMQYGHLNVDDIAALERGQYLEAGERFARHETRPNKWGASSGAHTDLRFVGVQDEGGDPDVEAWGYAVLDGRANVSNSPDKLRTDIMKFVNQKTKEGYRSNYPVLTDTQLKLVESLSKEMNTNKQLTDMLDVKNGFDTVRTLFGSEEKIEAATGFDDITAINAFQRMIDPGATVREGDVQLLEATIPFLERVDPSFKWSQLTKGDKLPATVRASLLRVASEVYNEKATGYNSTVGDRFKNRAKAAGIPFDLVGEDFVVFNEPVEKGLLDDRSLFEQIESGAFTGFTEDDINEFEAL